MKSYNKIMKKGGQITIFVIIAILIVVSIGLIIYANPGKIVQNANIKTNPHGFIQQCARDAATPAMNAVIPNGGIVNPAAGKYLSWQKLKPIWMCYTPNQKQICINQHPMISTEIENEVYNQIKPKIDACFAQLKNQFGNYDYKEGNLNLSVEIAPSKLYIRIDKKIAYTQNEVAASFENFDVQIASPLYEFIVIGNDILNQEVNCNCRNNNCNADITAINRDKREYETTRDVYGANDKIYSIKEVASGLKFNFAVRNCARLPY